MIAAATSLPADTIGTDIRSMLFPKKRFCFFDQVCTTLAKRHVCRCFLFDLLLRLNLNL